MRRVLLYTLGWFGGYLLCQGTWGGVAPLVAGAGLVWNGMRGGRVALAVGVWLCIGAACGTVIAVCHTLPVKAEAKEERRVRVEGRVEGVGSGSDQGSSRVRMRDTLNKFWVVSWPTEGVRGSLPRSGDLIAGLGRRESRGAPANPFEFNLQAFHAGQGVSGTVRLNCVVWRPGAGTTGVWDRVWAVVGDARESVGKHLDSLRVSSDVQAILRALVLGDSTGLSGSQRSLFSATGTAHLFAVSGLHLATFGELVVLLFALLSAGFPDRRGQATRERYASVLVLLGGIGYLLLTAAPVSCLRAFVMLAGRCVASMLGREYDAWTWLSVSALTIVCGRPEAMTEASFQLSVACVAAMLASGELARSWRKEGEGGGVGRVRIVGSLWGSACTSWASSLVTLPIVWRHFGGIPLLPVPANMIAVPLVSSVIFPLALVGGFLPLPELVSGWLGVGLEWLVGLMEAWLGGVVCVGGVVRLAWPGWVAASVVAGLLFVASFRGSLRFRAVLTAAAATVALVAIPSGLGAPDKSWEMIFFHAEEADIALLRTESGGTMLVDAGRKGAGRRLLLPYLWHHGIDRLDVVVISHAHDDHYGGMAEVAQEVRVCEYWVADGTAAVRIVEALATVGQGCDGPPRIRRWHQAESLQWGGFEWTSWWPVAGARGLGQNDSSLVLTGEDSQVVLLLPGDIEGKKAKRELETMVGALGQRAGPPEVRERRWVMKAPHHGHRSPLAAWLAQAVSPDVVFLPSEGPLVWWQSFWCATPCRRPPLVWLSGEKGAMTLVREGAEFSAHVQQE